MKKRTALLLILVIIMSILAFSLPLNIQLRTAIKANFEKNTTVPSRSIVVLGTQDHIYVDDYSEEVLEKIKSSSHMLMKVSWLSKLGMTTHYDEKKQQLNIVDGNQFITINQQGFVTWNGMKMEDIITLTTINGERYIAVDDLQKVDRTGLLKVQTDYIETRDVVMYTKEGFTDASAYLNDIKGIYADKAAVTAPEDLAQELTQWRALLTGPDLSEKTKPTQPVMTQNLGEGVVMVLTASGNIGYVPLEALSLVPIEEDKTFLKDATRVDGDVHLIWEAVYTRNPNVNTIGDLGTINVLSPTWYELADSEGTLSNLSGDQYINWSKNKGYLLWPLITNGFDPERTHLFLNDSDARSRFINLIAEEAVAKGYDGLNIDFENIYLEDKDALTHFINELSWVIKPLGITLSMDVTVIAESDNWSKCFDREALGKIVDYLVIMTYDEYWQSSPISGPVSSYDWMKNGLEEILKIVPSEKLVMGIPLYTRVWTEEISTDTNILVNNSTAISMMAQNAIIEERNLSVTWLEDDRLFYTAYIEDDRIHKMWIENLETITHKVNLSKALSLSGYAFWRRGFEPEQFFNDLSKATE